MIDINVAVIKRSIMTASTEINVGSLILSFLFTISHVASFESVLFGHGTTLL